MENETYQEEVNALARSCILQALKLVPMPLGVTQFHAFLSENIIYPTIDKCDLFQSNWKEIAKVTENRKYSIVDGITDVQRFIRNYGEACLTREKVFWTLYHDVQEKIYQLQPKY